MGYSGLVAYPVEILCPRPGSSHRIANTSFWQRVPFNEVQFMEILSSTVIVSMVVTLGILIRVVIKSLNEQEK
jgi:hypothetical protein